MGFTSAERYSEFRITCARPSIASMIGGRPGCVSSVQRAANTGHEASGLTTPSSTSCLRVGLAGRGRGRSGLVERVGGEPDLGSKKFLLAFRICERRLAVYTSWVY